MKPAVFGKHITAGIFVKKFGAATLIIANGFYTMKSVFKFMKKRKIDKPWGHEEIWAQCDKYVGKLLVIKPGERLSRQYHEIKDETIYVLKGELVLEIGEESDMERLFLMQGASYHITPGTIHRFAAPSCGCTLVEVSTPELDDVVRLQDDYGREKTDL